MPSLIMWSIFVAPVDRADYGSTPLYRHVTIDTQIVKSSTTEFNVIYIGNVTANIFYLSSYKLGKWRKKIRPIPQTRMQTKGTRGASKDERRHNSNQLSKG